MNLVFLSTVKWMQSIAGEEPDDETIIVPDEPEEEEELKRGTKCFFFSLDGRKKNTHFGFGIPSLCLLGDVHVCLEGTGHIW